MPTGGGAEAEPRHVLAAPGLARLPRSIATVSGGVGMGARAGTSPSTSARPTPSSTSGAAGSSSTSRRSSRSRPAPASSSPPGTGPRRCSAARPGTVRAVRPLRDGVISDADVTERMLRWFVDQVAPVAGWSGRAMVVCVPERDHRGRAPGPRGRRPALRRPPGLRHRGADGGRDRRGPAGRTRRPRVDGRRHRRRHHRRRRHQPRRHRHLALGAHRRRRDRRGRSSPTSRASTPCCSASAAPRTSRSAPARPSPCARS